MFERCRAALLATLLAVPAAEAVPLFKNYEAGTSRAVLESQPGVYPCEARLLCLDDQMFLGQTVHLAFTVDLTGLVAVGVDFSESDMTADALFSPLERAGFMLVGVLNTKTTEMLDLVHLYRTSPATVEGQYGEFLNRVGNLGQVTFLLVEKTESLKPKVGAVRSYAELYMGLEADTRLLEIRVDEDDASIWLVFSLPGSDVAEVEGEEF